MGKFDDWKSSVRQLGSGGQFIKKSMIVVNALILIGAIALIIVGGVAAAHQVNGLTSTTLATAIIVIGCLLFFVALLGCFAALMENHRMLLVFFGFLVFFALAEVVIGVVAYIRRDDLPQLASDAWTGLYETDKKAISDLEDTFQCCGWYNISDRAAPPIGDEDTCATFHPGYGACNDGIYNALYFVGHDKTSEPGRQALRDFQTQHQCCGWWTQEDPLFLPFYSQNYTICQQNIGNVPPCSGVVQKIWYNAKQNKQDSVIIDYEEQYRCCGWNTTADTPVPPYSNLTCINVKKFETPCSESVDNAVAQSLYIVGGVGIAVGAMQLLSIILCLTMIILTRKRNRGRPQRLEELMEDANRMHTRLHDESEDDARSTRSRSASTKKPTAPPPSSSSRRDEPPPRQTRRLEDMLADLDQKKGASSSSRSGGRNQPVDDDDDDFDRRSTKSRSSRKPDTSSSSRRDRERESEPSSSRGRSSSRGPEPAPSKYDKGSSRREQDSRRDRSRSRSRGRPGQRNPFDEED